MKENQYIELKNTGGVPGNSKKQQGSWMPVTVLGSKETQSLQ